MIYFADASGAVARCVPERVFQGSAEGSRIYLVAPFSQSETVSVSFRLPDGASTRPYLLSYEGKLDGMTDEQGTPLHGWSLLLPAAVTADFGTVSVQFYCNASGIATEAVQFTVERGVRRELPEVPSGEAYEEIVAAVTALQSDLSSGYYAARAMYAYNSARIYAANELAFVADAGERGAIVRSLHDDNTVAPYGEGGALASEYWAEAVRFDDLYQVEESASSYASSAAAMAENARQYAEDAQTAVSSAQSGASSAQTNAEAASASADLAAENASAAQADALSAQTAAQQAQEILSQVTEIAGGNYVAQSDFDEVISGTRKVGAAVSADTAQSAQSAVNAQNVTVNIAGKPITSIFESDGVTVKAATKADDDGNGEEIASTYVKKSDLVDLVYPVGTVIINYSSSSSPASKVGGTWLQITDGRFLLASGGSYALGTTGGESTHVLTISEMPSHTHTIYNTESNSECSAYVPQNGNSLWGSADATFSGWGGVSKGLIQTAGSGTAHNNMPPYRVVSMWRRTA